MISTIEKKFNDMGARVKILNQVPHRTLVNFAIDIRKDQEGEYFELLVPPKAKIDLSILDLQKADRHLLLLMKEHKNKEKGGGFDETKAKFLCGHDERNWFTCAIPERLKVSTVFEAKEALKPQELRDLEAKEGLKRSRAQKRHRKLDSGKKIHRQGEFMFIPQLGFQPPSGFSTVIHRNEPMRGGGMHNHMAQFLYRTGGETVHVSNYNAQTIAGLTDSQYKELLRKSPAAAAAKWDIMTRNPTAYVKGKISHEEHATLDLGESVWHKVVMNTEGLSKARQNVTFKD